MSDRDLRRLLLEIIDDLDAGRVRPYRPRRLVRWLRAPVLATSLGLGLGVGASGCDNRAIGYVDDAGVQQVDSGSNADAGPPLDAELPVDAGNIFAYGIPPIDEDAGTEAMDAATEEWDGGAYDLYGVPFQGEDASMDPPPEAMYAAPDFEFDPDAGS